MAARRSRRTAGPDVSRTSAARAAAIAEQLLHECSILQELFKKKESFTTDVLVADGRLVSVPPPSSHVASRDKLWLVHSALLQCRSLMERAVVKEEEELGDGTEADYETQRKVVKDRLSLLVVTTGELLKALDGAAVPTPSTEGLELDGPTLLFELKIWVYRIYKEVDYWTKAAITTLQGLPTVIAKERARVRSTRSTRSTRR